MHTYICETKLYALLAARFDSYKEVMHSDDIYVN